MNVSKGKPLLTFIFFYFNTALIIPNPYHAFSSLPNKESASPDNIRDLQKTYLTKFRDSPYVFHDLVVF